MVIMHSKEKLIQYKERKYVYIECLISITSMQTEAANLYMLLNNSNIFIVLSEVHEIRVSPCAGAEDNEPCQWRKGSDARIEIDFTPSNITKIFLIKLVTAYVTSSYHVVF